MKSARFRLRVAAKDGEDVLQAVTDNQHDSFVLDSTGKALAAQQRSTNVRLWLGSKQQTISSVDTTLSYVGGGSVPSGVTVGHNITTDSGAVTGNVAIANVNVRKNTMLTDDLQCTIIVTCAEGTRTVVFSLSRVMSGADGKTPVRWQLLLSQTQLAFQRTRGGFTPAQQVVGVQVQRDDGNGIVNMGLEQAYYDYHMAVCAATGEPPSSYSSSQRIDSDITVSNTDVGDGVSAIGLSLFDIASSTAFLHDKQSLTIVKDGADGGKGTDGTMTQRCYKSTNSSTAPTTNLPSGDTLNGWSLNTPTAISSSQRYRYRCERSTDSTGAWSAWTPPVIDGYMPEDGTSISIKGRSIGVTTQECEDAPLDAMCRYILSPQVDQSIVVYGDVVLCNGSQTYDKVQYIDSTGVFRSVTDSSPGDCYIDLDGHLWQRNSASTGVRWVDVGQIKGEKGDKGDKGDDGDNAVQYQLQLNIAAVNYNTNAVGDYIGPDTTDITATAVKTDGTAVTVGNSGPYQVFSRPEYTQASTGNKSYLSWTGAANAKTYQLKKSLATNPTLAITAIQFKLATSASAAAIVTASVPVTLGGRVGHDGARGRLFYPMGEWQAQDYAVDDDKIPMVFYPDQWNEQLGVYGDYWYLDPDAAQATAADVPGSSEVWKRAENYGVVITQGLFALFAKLGSFVVSQDFVYSTLGDLLNSDGTPATVSATPPAYTYFNDADPMACRTDVSGSWPRFRPRLVINAYNGEMYAASGKMHVSAAGDITMQGASMTEATVSGTVRASNLFRTLAVLSSAGWNIFSPDSPQGTTWRYMTQAAYDDIAYEEPTLAPQWPVGSYLSYSQYIDTFGGSDAAGMWTTLQECIGFADRVEVVLSNTTTHRNIYLPRCQDVAGKLVEVSNLHSSAPLYVYQADQASAFQFIDGNGSLYSRMPVAAATQVSFYSTGLRWLAIYGSST